MPNLLIGKTTAGNALIKKELSVFTHFTNQVMVTCIMPN